MNMQLLERVVGVTDESSVEPIHSSEPLMLNVGTATTVGVVTSAREGEWSRYSSKGRSAQIKGIVWL